MTTNPILVSFTGVQKTYDGTSLVVRDLNLDIRQGECENISPTIAAVATLLILFTACLMMTLEWLRGRVKK